MLNLEQIGHKITKQRKLKQMTQKELAEALYVTHQAVSKWENGKSVPSIEILYDITQLFNISIDYLLDDSDIPETDYEMQFKQYPRKAVISKFLHNNSCCDNLEDIFYLLQTEERDMIIELIISQNIVIDFEKVWHIFSKSERIKIISVILSGKFEYDLHNIYQRLTRTEQLLIQSKDKEGNYSIHTNKGVIL
jgi:transcriptional regulator with XRE-family HTH domain